MRASQVYCSLRVKSSNEKSQTIQINMKIKLVVASRAGESDFLEATAIGRSLFARPDFVEVRLFPNNKDGLPKVYNQAIRETINEPATLVFAHDDIHLLDYLWFFKIQEALSNFDIVGLAGNKRRVPKQPAWLFLNTNFTWDDTNNLSGLVGHGKRFPPESLSVYGEPRQKVMLLDGLLLASHSQTLISKGIFFDERFDFHFYDMDFCRQAEVKNVSCGTWDLSVIHESKGSFGSPDWRRAYQKYIEKWGD
jgi:hypothetical protein